MYILIGLITLAVLVIKFSKSINALLHTAEQDERALFTLFASVLCAMVVAFWPLALFAILIYRWAYGSR